MKQSKQVQKISQKLHDIGACWAVTSEKYLSPNDPEWLGERRQKTWHVHPVANYPHQKNVMRFETLKELEQWVDSEIL